MLSHGMISCWTDEYKKFKTRNQYQVQFKTCVGFGSIILVTVASQYIFRAFMILAYEFDYLELFNISNVNLQI